MYILLLGMLLSTSLVFAENKEMSHTEYVFTNVYNESLWWTGETYSGCGSNLHQTQLIRQEIPRIIKKFKIKSMLDIPCGDFHWMRYVTIKIPYIGADIVKELVIENQNQYGNETRVFIHLDLITDDLPEVDLILCRDCLVHLSYEQIWQALRTIKKSGSKYLLVTSYTNTVTNQDISAGCWRPLNLMRAPFNFKKPIFIFSEGYERDKCLMMWKIDELPL